MPLNPSIPVEGLIRKIGAAGDVSASDLRAIIDLPFTVRTIAANKAIVYQGNPSSRCCVVLDGWIRCEQSVRGRRQIVSIHIPGDWPDLQSLLLPHADFGMAAVVDTRIAFVSHSAIKRLIVDHATAASTFWRETFVTAAIQRTWITALGRRSGRGRMAHFLCEIYLRLSAVGLAEAYVFPMPLRQVELADMLGQTSVHINRILQEFRGERLISLHSRRVEIHNWERLCAEAEFDPSYLYLPTDSAGSVSNAPISS